MTPTIPEDSSSQNPTREQELLKDFNEMMHASHADFEQTRVFRRNFCAKINEMIEAAARAGFEAARESVSLGHPQIDGDGPRYPDYETWRKECEGK